MKVTPNLKKTKAFLTTDKENGSVWPNLETSFLKYIAPLKADIIAAKPEWYLVSME